MFVELLVVGGEGTIDLNLIPRVFSLQSAEEPWDRGSGGVFHGWDGVFMELPPQGIAATVCLVLALRRPVAHRRASQKRSAPACLLPWSLGRGGAAAVVNGLGERIGVLQVQKSRGGMVTLVRA